MINSSTYTVFEVEGGMSKLPSCYFINDESTKDVDQLMQKVLQYYQSHDCSVQVLMGRCIQELTQVPVVPVKELFKSTQNS